MTPNQTRSILLRALVAATLLALLAVAAVQIQNAAATDDAPPARRAHVTTAVPTETVAPVEIPAVGPSVETPPPATVSSIPGPELEPTTTTTTTTVPLSACPSDGTPFAHGSCVLGDDVAPAPDTMHVEAGAPSKVCEYQGQRFECPANYEVPA